VISAKAFRQCPKRPSEAASFFLARHSRRFLALGRPSRDAEKAADAFFGSGPLGGWAVFGEKNKANISTLFSHKAVFAALSR